MTVWTIQPSGDVSGVTDAATVTAALALMGAGDELIFATDLAKQWYFRPTGNAHNIVVNANNQTFTFGNGSTTCYVNLVGLGAATTECGIIKCSGFTGVTIQGSPLAQLDGGRYRISQDAVGKEVVGGCVTIANQNVWGSDNAMVVKNLYLKDGWLWGFQLNSVQGLTMTDVTSWATCDPLAFGANVVTAGGHGNDFDAVALNKPTKDCTFTRVDFDSYASECMKLENVTNLTYTNCIFRNIVSHGQDNGDAYDQFGPITYTNCTFYAPTQNQKLKRRGIAASNTPAATLTATSAAIGAGVTFTAAGRFAAGDVGKYIAATGSSGILGLALITSFIDASNVVATSIQTWVSAITSTGIATGGWTLGSVDQGGNGSVTYTNCSLIGDAAVWWGKDPIVANYGTQTFTNCTAVDDDGVLGGGSMIVFPAGVTLVESGNKGRRQNVLHYVKPKPPAKVYSGYYGANGQNGVYSYPSSWMCAQEITTACAAAFMADGDEVVIMDGSYFTASGTNTETASYNASGNRNITANGKRINIRAKHKYKAILDGTGGATGSNVVLDTSAPTGSYLQGLLIQNYTSGNNCAVNLQTTSCLSVRDCWFYGMTNTNGGAGIRSTTTGTPVFDNLLFTSCSTSATGGGGMYTTSVNARYSRLYFDTCTFSGATQGGGAVRFDFATVALYPIFGLVATGCSTTNSGANGGAVIARNCTIVHMSATGNTSVAASPAADIYTPSQTLVLKNSILRSAGAVVVNTGATLQYANSNINGGPTGGGTNTDQGGNIDSDPLWYGVIGGASYNFRLKSSSSSSYRTGTFIDWAKDQDNNLFAVPPSMGAYELLPARTTATTRTTASTRTAATRERAPRVYP